MPRLCSYSALAAFLVFLKLALSALGYNCPNGIDDIQVNEVKFDVDRRDRNHRMGSFADVYNCPEFQDNPVIIFAPGGTVPKASYSNMASRFVEKGFVVLVLEHLRTVGPSIRQNFVIPIDLELALDYVETNANSFGMDISNVFLLGHSFGAAMIFYALSGDCPRAFCVRRWANRIRIPFLRVPISVQSKVKAAGCYGCSLRKYPGRGWYEPDEFGLPFFMVNGEGDFSNLRVDENTGEDGSVGSFNRFSPPKFLSVIDNMDHFSIANEIVFSMENDVLSDRSREDQNEIVTEILYYYMLTEMEGNNTSLCLDLENRGTFLEVPYEMEKCLEQYS